MKGQVYFVFVLAFLFPLASILAFELQMEKQMAQTKDGAIKIERINCAESEIENAIRQTMQEPIGNEGDLRMIPIRLAILENRLEKKMGREGIDADLWFGSTTKMEIGKLKEAGILGKSNPKCLFCNDFSKITLDYDKKPQLLSFAFISNEMGRNIISKRGLTRLPEAANLAYALGEVYFGATLYFRKIGASSGVLLPEGFG
jgi:hypothetical protein